MWTKVAIAAGIIVLVAGVALVSVPDQDASGVSPISLDDDAVRRDEDATTEVDGTDDDDDGDGDSTRGNDGTGGGNNTWRAAWSGDGDNTGGNDGTGGGAWSASHQGDGDATRGNDGTSGGIDGDDTAGNDGTGGGNNSYVYGKFREMVVPGESSNGVPYYGLSVVTLTK